MYNFNFDISSLFHTASVLIIFFIFVIIAISITLYVFSSLGIMYLAKKNKLDNHWMAFIPVARSYLIAKLGYELYVPMSKKNSTLTWVTLGVAAATFLFGEKDSGYLLDIALLVFEGMAFYNIFKALGKNEVIYTIFTILTLETLGGIFLYANRNKFKETPFKTKEKKFDLEENKEEINQENEIKKEIKRPKFCSECGYKLNQTAKFCSNCGKKVE